jgi:phosphoglycolate phosphatase
MWLDGRAGTRDGLPIPWQQAERQMDGVIFDKDGTLFDFKRSWGVWAARMLRALSSDEAHAHRMGRAVGYDLASGRFDPQSPVIAATNDEIAMALMAELPGQSLRDVAGRLHGMAAEAPMIPATDLPEVLGRLRAMDLKLGVATNDSARAAHAHLAAHDILGLFDFVAGADSGHGAKPEPGMLRAFARQMGLAPARVAMVGDSRHDLLAGRAAGMVTVGVLTGVAETADLADLADVVLADISHLPGWIAAQRAG